MARIEVGNWFGNVESHPAVPVEAETVEEIVAILRDRERYPNPVRAVGSNAAPTPCGAAEGGTLIVMRRMDRIVEIAEDRVTAQAGALSWDVARELRKHHLQFFVNPELGNLTIGSAACGGTRDASMPGELGQVASYATSIKMIRPDGELVEVTEAEPELLQLVRSSYGLLGIVYEATFRVRPLVPMRVYHERGRFADFERVLPELRRRGESITAYLDPFTDAALVELRKYRDEPAGQQTTDGPWNLRSAIWTRRAPGVAHLVDRLAPARGAQHFLTDLANRLVVLATAALVRGDHTAATAQQVRYPSTGGDRRRTFSTWAFPEDRYVECVRRYFAFARQYDKEHGYRANLLAAGRRLDADQGSLLSCSFDGPMMTLDPVSTGGPGWEDFLRAYNDLCSELGGVPLLDQTGLLTRAHAEKAFGDRLARFEARRRELDPADRLLNPHFQELLGQPAPVAAAASG